MKSWSDRLAAGLAVAALLFLVGAVYAGLTLPQRPKPTDYNLQINARMAGDDEVVAEGTTNLPDGARLMVTVERLYRLRGSGTWHSARTGETTVEVNEGRWEARVKVDDDSWVDELVEKVNRGEVDPIEVVRSGLRATVIFAPTVPQVGFVWESMGAGFEGLAKSESAWQTGNQWMIRREAMVEQPLAREHLERLVREGDS